MTILVKKTIFNKVNFNSYKDKLDENEISNSKSEKMNSFKDNYKQKSIINYNINLFCFENSNIKNFKRYFSFIK